MALFLDSTQATSWTIPADKLADRRARVNSRIQESILKQVGHNADIDGEDGLLTIDEEATLRRYHERRILKFVRRMRLHDKIGATAVAYFKRFYVDRSIIEFNPSVIALSSLYAASKVEEVHLPADELVNKFDIIVNGIPQEQVERERSITNKANSTVLERWNGQIHVADGTAIRVHEDALLQTELVFLQRLQFHLVCYHGFRSLGALREVLKTQDMWGSESNDNNNGGNSNEKRENEMIRKVCRKAHEYIGTRVPLTELILTDTPAVIALAVCAVCAVDEGAERDDDAAITAVLQTAAEGMEAVGSAVRSAVWTLRESGELYEASERTSILQGLEERREKWQMAENDPMSQRFREMKEEEDELRFHKDREALREGGAGGKRLRDGNWSDDDIDNGADIGNDDKSRRVDRLADDGGSVKRVRLGHV